MYRELEIINPDIIMCGYTSHCLRAILGEKWKNNETYMTLFGEWNGKLVIDYYHPAGQYPNRVNYYALMSICRVAVKKIEKDEKRSKAKLLLNDKKEVQLPQAQDGWEHITIEMKKQNNRLRSFGIFFARESNETLKNIELNSYKAAIGAINPDMSKVEIDKFVNDLTEGKLEGELISRQIADSTWKVYVKDNYEYSFVEETNPKAKYHIISYNIQYINEKNFTPEVEELYKATLKSLKK